MGGEDGAIIIGMVLEPGIPAGVGVVPAGVILHGVAAGIVVLVGVVVVAGIVEVAGIVDNKSVLN